MSTEAKVAISNQLITKSTKTEELEYEYEYPKRIIWYLFLLFLKFVSYIIARDIYVMFIEHVNSIQYRDITKMDTIITILKIITYPVAGILADGYFGKFWQMLVAELVYIHVISLKPVVSAMPDKLPSTTITISERAMTAIIKPFFHCCTGSFAGDQYHFPEQTLEFIRYLCFSYWLYRFSCIIGYPISLYMSHEWKCFGEKTCYFASFLTPIITNTFFIICLFLTRSVFTKAKPDKNHSIILYFNLMVHALKIKKHSKEKMDKKHWMDYANDKYDGKDIEDAKRMKCYIMIFGMLLVAGGENRLNNHFFIQAHYVQGDLGFWTFKPEYLNLFKYVFCCIFTIILAYVWYPLFEKYDIRAFAILGITSYLFAFSFMACGLVSLAIESNEPKPPKEGESQIVIYNNLNESLYLSGEIFDGIVTIGKMSYYRNNHIQVYGNRYLRLQYNKTYVINGNFWANLTEQECRSFYFLGNGSITSYEYKIETKHLRSPTVRTLVSSNETLDIKYETDKLTVETGHKNIDRMKSETGLNKLYVNGKLIHTTYLELGCVYITLITQLSKEKFIVEVLEMQRHNFVNVLWLIPQLLLYSLAEPLFIVSMEEYFYTQSPRYMKAFSWAMYEFSIHVGDYIVILIDQSYMFQYVSSINFFYFALIHVNIIFVYYLGTHYESVVEMNARRSGRSQISIITSQFRILPRRSFIRNYFNSKNIRNRVRGLFP